MIRFTNLVSNHVTMLRSECLDIEFVSASADAEHGAFSGALVWNRQFQVWNYHCGSSVGVKNTAMGQLPLMLTGGVKHCNGRI